MRSLGDLRDEFGSPDEGPLGLDEYQRCAVQTYRGPDSRAEKGHFLLLGLFGEVGSLLSELKKKQRDRSAYLAYASSSLEETGDVLWYLANFVDHCGFRFTRVSVLPSNDAFSAAPPRYFKDIERQAPLFQEPAAPSHVQASLLKLAETVGALIARSRTPVADEELVSSLAEIFAQLVSASNDAQVNLTHAANLNLDKLLGRWPLRRAWGPLLDAGNERSEQFPRLMCVRFEERFVNSRLYVYQSVNGEYIGDPLTDNSAQEDDYRFHDIFHLAFATFLTWSPVLRSFLKVRRISRADINEQQDGARAKITEEGISNWIFSHGLRHEAFAHVDSLDFALLKTIAHMVKGYEVQVQAPWMWECAILEGFRIFRSLRAHRGGLVTADLEARRLSFEAVA
jgi:NTP pyrophosphatase (non-canonical NTP hydrolase)